jgi:haloalkane dehalogenase
MAFNSPSPCLPWSPNWFQQSDGCLHYLDVGQGKPVVCLHGNPDWSFSYRKVIEGLRSSYRCLALDHLGFGYSAKPLAANYHPQAHTDRLAAWVHELDLQEICLVLNDWSGPIGLAFAQRYPERVEQLVLMNTWMWPLSGYWLFPTFSWLMSGQTGRLLTGYANVFSTLLLWLAIYRKSAFQRWIHQCYQKPYQTPDDRVAQYSMPYYLMAANEWFQSLYEHRSKIAHKPTALVWGMKDPAFRPAFLKTWEKVIPGAHVTRLYKAGHFPQEDQPGSVTSAIQQLTA